MATDLRRSANIFNLPWASGWPDNYPFKATTLKVQRVLTAIEIDHPNHYPEVISALYHAFWVEKKGVQLPEVHYPIIACILGEESATKILERSSSDEIKALLKQNTEHAIASGCPGLPWVMVTNTDGKDEGYFGFDHLSQVAHFLGLGMSIGPNL
ncbi:hypothetical protein LTR84_010302 [Exophiala bonariae]|uniref:DSBA-like thioredoxin domain-containing protein n=1 Tax=Exophiala bonariae TaxID=1690606 RepID=A0AAV9MX64_9EURO|nr:hypothetical protein LTR84_010302 [Exophiala bonariae]